MVYVLSRLLYRWSGSRKVIFSIKNMYMIYIPPIVLAGSFEGEVAAMTGTSTVINMQKSHYLI